MKIEDDFRNIDPEWLRKDGGNHYILAAIFAFTATLATAMMILSAKGEQWPHALILALLAAILWRRVFTNTSHAFRCYDHAERNETRNTQ